jgi:hypothetical protein
MKNLLKVSLLFLMLFTIKVNAQNYSPIVDGNTSLFNFNGSIEALHVDSITSDPKGLGYHFFKTWDEIIDYQNCHPYHNASWAGAKCVVSGNTFYFFNKDLDTIVFQPTMEINDSWKLYTYADNKYIQATISSKTLESFLTFTDSVKTISLQLKDANGNSLSSDVNSLQLQLSKNYGCKQFCNVYEFPTNPSSAPLVGTTLPQAGLQLLSVKDIYDYQIGDEFHYHTYYDMETHTIIKTIKRVLNVRVSLNTDTVIYEMKEFREITDHSDNLISYTEDTIFESIVINEPTFYPNQAIIGPDMFLDQRYSSYTYTANVNYNNRSLIVPSENPYYFKEQNCWQFIILEGSEYAGYAAGLGLTTQYSYNTPTQEGYETHLVYFKKGTEEWGTALTLSTYKKTEQSSSLYPNPLQQGQQLQIETGNFQTKQVTIYNAIGTRVKDISNTVSSIGSIDVSELQPGLYVIQLLNEKNEFITSKLIIK